MVHAVDQHVLVTAACEVLLNCLVCSIRVADDTARALPVVVSSLAIVLTVAPER
jgi:hypothetical protein